MALYRFEAKVISRRGGRSSVASAAYRTGKCATSAAAYRAGAKLTDERTGQHYDYTKKGGIAGAEIMTPDGAPEWMRDRARLWNAVEVCEKRADAQLARDFILSLPHELTAAQRAELTRDFVREQFTARGFVADIAWHSPDRADSLNHHAHVMVPMRKVEGDGFARLKERAPEGVHPSTVWKEELARLREAWADTANRHLAAAGLNIRLDHRSLEARSIEREPEPKQGPLATQIEREGRESFAGRDRRAVQARNAERAGLRAEHAAAVGEEAQIIDLMRERDRRAAQQAEQQRAEEARALAAARELALRAEQERRRQEAEKARVAEQARQENLQRQEAQRQALERARALSRNAEAVRRAEAMRALEKAAKSDSRALRLEVPEQIADARRQQRQTARQERRESWDAAAQEAWRMNVRERSPDQPRPVQKGLQVVNSTTGLVSGLADFMAGIVGGLAGAATRTPDMKAYVSDPAARKEQQLARLAAARAESESEKAIERIREDMEKGKALSSADIQHLTHQHQMQIYAKGDDYVRQMVEDARRRSERASRSDGRERE